MQLVVGERHCCHRRSHGQMQWLENLQGPRNEGICSDVAIPVMATGKVGDLEEGKWGCSDHQLIGDQMSSFRVKKNFSFNRSREPSPDFDLNIQNKILLIHFERETTFILMPHLTFGLPRGWVMWGHCYLWTPLGGDWVEGFVPGTVNAKANQKGRTQSLPRERNNK